MTSADDALFEPLHGPVIPNTAPGGILPSGIMKGYNSTTINIITANPRHIYTDAATEMMDYAAKCHPQMVDVRKTTNPPIFIPLGAFRLDTLVERFHNGTREFWVACPGLTPPKQFEFAGRFGHLKVWRFAQQIGTVQTSAFVAEWFWVDSTDGQLSAIELGILLVHPTLHLHHIFANQTEAQSYYRT